MPEQETDFRCEVCGSTFSDSEALAKHMRVHTAPADEEELAQGLTPPMGDTGLPPAAETPAR